MKESNIYAKGMSRRRLLQVLSAAAGATALSACAPSAPGTSQASPTGGASAPPRDFSFAGWSLSEDAPKPVIQAQLDTFAADAGVTITPVSYPYNEYLNQMVLQVRGGQFTGAAQLDIAWLGTMTALGKLVDLGPLTDGRGYTASALKAGQFNGVQYGLPWTTAAIGLVANSEILGRVGAKEIPATIDQFEALLRELKGSGVIPYAASTKMAQLKDVQMWMQTFGSPLMENGKIVIGDDPSVAAVNWYKKLYDEGLIAPDVDRFDARSLFAQGKAAMYDDAPVGRAGVLKASTDANLGSKLLPASRPVLKSGDKPAALAWGHVIMVVDGPGAQTAGKFAQWVTSEKDVVVNYFAKLGLPPTTDAALASSEVTGDKFVSDFTQRITATATPSPFWAYPQYGQIDTAINERIQAVLIGQQDAATALKQARDTAQKLVG
jgi:multiple sugar transport system substrate-binding protein